MDTLLSVPGILTAPRGALTLFDAAAFEDRSRPESRFLALRARVRSERKSTAASLQWRMQEEPR